MRSGRACPAGQPAPGALDGGPVVSQLLMSRLARGKRAHVATRATSFALESGGGGKRGKKGQPVGWAQRHATREGAETDHIPAHDWLPRGGRGIATAARATTAPAALPPHPRCGPAKGGRPNPPTPGAPSRRASPVARPAPRLGILPSPKPAPIHTNRRSRLPTTDRRGHAILHIHPTPPPLPPASQQAKPLPLRRPTNLLASSSANSPPTHRQGTRAQRHI